MSRFDYDPMDNPVPAPVRAIPVVTRRELIAAEAFGSGPRLALRTPLDGPRRATHVDRLAQRVPVAAPMPGTPVERERREGVSAVRGVLAGLLFTAVGVSGVVAILAGIGLAAGWWF